MDSWTLQGDSYSFLRSAPRTFSLRNRDGTPNHVEIFDIINTPSQRSAISETTCLCDIFGDDCESPSLSSSPAVGAFVPSQREVGETAAASPSDDLNDSSGSYHTAHGSSEGEEGFEDSGERLCSPSILSESSERGQPESEGKSSGNPEVTDDSSPITELTTTKSPVPLDRGACLSSEAPDTGERTPSPGHKSPYTLSSEGRASSLSSSSVEKRYSPSSPYPRRGLLEAEAQRITPTFDDTHQSPSYHSSSNPSPSPGPRNCISSASSESVNTESVPESRVARASPVQRSSYCQQHSSPLPEITSKDISLEYTASTLDARAILSSPLPLSSSTELSSKSRESPASPEPTRKDFYTDFAESAFESKGLHSSPLSLSSRTELSFERESREALVSPELKNRSYSPDTQTSSPFPDLRGRISLPDLFSRCSTPDIEDCTHTPELISERDTTATPESQDTRLSAEPVSPVSTPAPRYTPPSPIISIATSPELVESSVSAEVRPSLPSPGLLSASSPAQIGTRSPSPDPSHKIRSNSTPSEIGTQLSSPRHSLSPSPEVRSNCSPTAHEYTSPSPLIRITPTSPEASRRDHSPEVLTSASPFLQTYPASVKSRSVNSSPHITGISYSVIQPEDRVSPPFPELAFHSTPEPDSTLVSPEARSPTLSRESVQSGRVESTGTPQDPLISDLTSSLLQPEITPLHQSRNQVTSPQLKHLTPSPELRDKSPSPEAKYKSPSPEKNLRPSPEVRYKSPSPENHQSPSSQQRIKDPSPPALSPNQSCDQHSPQKIPTESSCQYTHSTSPLRNTPDGDSSSSKDIKSQYPTHLATAKETEPKEENCQDNLSLASFCKEKGVTAPTFFATTPSEIKPPYLKNSKDKSPDKSIVGSVTSNSPSLRSENPPPLFKPFPNTSQRARSLKSACAPEHKKRQVSISVRREHRDRSAEDMAHHVGRRRTPSPPLTRFTPVHIIAPEKPYRQWQNRGHSPSQVGESSTSGTSRKVPTQRESPSVAPVDNYSQPHWARLGTELEMERNMRLEEEREVGRLRESDRAMERERKREEQVPEKGRGWQGDASYRGEQVELSFNARNRKGPVSRRTAPTSRETRQGLPTVHSYSDSLPATRQLQPQHSLSRLPSQQESRAGAPSRRLQPPSPQNKNSAPGRAAGHRPGRSSSSSMGSELDEADSEVKWFTDVAFSSLSSSEVDYLDMYNSSHRSSANISQPSTQESPAGVNAAWLSYADLRGSVSKLDNDELFFQQPSAYYTDCLDPSRRYEMGSFECVDVAVEREDVRKVRKGVPKRQIQLKRKNNSEGKQEESSENSSPGIPIMLESPSLETHSREPVMRHSTPAEIQECFPSQGSPELDPQNDRKFQLQKSSSLDETDTKTKMATCLIKSVLSKKMQSDDQQPNEQGEEDVRHTFEEMSPSAEGAAAHLKDSQKPDAHSLSSSLQSGYLSEGLPVRREPGIKDEAKPKSFEVRASHRPGSSSSSRSVTFSQSESEEADSQSRNAPSSRSEMRSELKVPFDSKPLRPGIQRADDRITWDEREGDDSANATARNTAPSATGACSPLDRMTNKDQECENTEDHKQLLRGDKSDSMVKTQELTLKAAEKKKASLNVCLTPEAENKPEGSLPDMSSREKEERVETGMDEKTEEEDGNGNNQVKVPIHKVRDVRRLVKNTYNLSFKASSAVMPPAEAEERKELFNQEKREDIKEDRREDVTVKEEIRQDMRGEERREEEREEEFRMDRMHQQKEKSRDSELRPSSQPLQRKGTSPVRAHPMQIEYKAVCWKEDKNKSVCSKKDSEIQGLSPDASEKLVTEVSRDSSQENRGNDSTGDTAFVKPYQQDANVAAETKETVTENYEVPGSEVKPTVSRTDKKPPMLGSLPKQPSKEREVSTAVVLIKEGSSRTKSSASPAQEERPTLIQSSASSASPGPIPPGSAAGSSGHSVSMLIKEKGYQADIGAVVGDSQNAAGGKGVTHKHVNCLEIPLQTTTASDGGRTEPHRERTFSSSSTSTSGPSAVPDSTDSFTKTREDEGINTKPPLKDPAKHISSSPLRNTQEQTPPPPKQRELGDFEAVKRLDPTFPPRSPAIRRFRPQPIEVKSLSKETQKQEMSTNSSGNNRPQSIEVKSIAKNSQKPVVPPKPSGKFRPADLGIMSNEAQKPSATTVKPQADERQQTIVVSSPTIYRKISHDSTSTSNYTRKVSVSAVSSLKPPPCKTTASTVSNPPNQLTAPSETDASPDGGQQILPGASPQSSSNRPIILAKAPPLETDPGLTSAPGPVSGQNVNQVPETASAGANQLSQPAVRDPDSQPQHARMAYPHEQTVPATTDNTKPSTAVSTTQVPGYTRPPCRRSLSGERTQRTDDLRFYASDDPPSYDERESFSPLMLPDLTPRRQNRYQPSSRPPLCSCTTGCPSHTGLTPPHHYHSPHNHTPPATSHSPGQALPYPVAQPPLRAHPCRPDPQPMGYQRGSPKASPLGPSQPPAMYQPLHQPPPCPPHPSLMQTCPPDRPLQPPQHIDPRRPTVHRSPQQQPPPGMPGAPYSDSSHSHSPGLPPMDPQYLCGPQSLGPSYGSEYGGDTSSLYSESSYGQTPRRVLLDPETGKYFYIEVPVQPLRKMLFDPETGQYVEVLIPQQAMSHSGLYPPSAAPYPSLHNPNMYAPASQYMPYAAPAPQAHPQPPPQPPRYPETSATATMHSSGPGVGYRNPPGQGSKPEPQNHTPLDQSYLESMYYVPTGMNASPNPTPPDYYHKHPPSLPPTGGKRS